MPGCSEHTSTQRATMIRTATASPPLLQSRRARSSMMTFGSMVCCVAALLVLCACSGQFPSDASKSQAAEAAYDGARLLASLNAIESWHINKDTGIASALNSGLDGSSIEQALSGPHCKATEELKLLWSWRDGAISPGS